ncbi:MAG: DMT family transporter [Anaerolineales bacterium]|nr:DMT family transporter [Anaerolineales bacterium]
MQSAPKTSLRGVSAALGSAFFLGLAPVFGRQAILLGVPPLAVVAIRTTLAALLLLGVMLVLFRRYLYIYPAGLLGCLLAGVINGAGSLFYYFALSRINASLGQLLYSLYPLFLMIWLSLDKQPPSRLTIFRLILIIPAIFLLIQGNHASGSAPVDLVGVAAMLVASILYALHLPFNQRVLYDMPPQTVTLYTLLAMSAVVIPVSLFAKELGLMGVPIESGSPALLADSLSHIGAPLLGLTLVTFISRLMLFTGVKHLGGMQTALLGLGELLVTLIFAHFWLGEQFNTLQWLGAALLVISLALVALESPDLRKSSPGGFLSWLRPSGQTVSSLTDTYYPHE